MKRLFKTALCSSVALAAIAASVPAVSQEITSGIRGTVVSPTGAAVAGATVTISDSRTGFSRTVTTSAGGIFIFRGLSVGGPYTVRVTSDDYQNQAVTEIFTTLGGTQALAINLAEVSNDIEEISIVASRAVAAKVAIGPSSTFDLSTIQSLPSISRQIRDVIRIDPRVNIGAGSGGEGFGISCAGGSPRANSFTIDGVRANDPFGLNASGNLSRSTFPIPFDSVAATSVEFSPVNVEYGAFTGCNINVVTKSGTNEFHGSAFFLFNSDDVSGSKIDGVDVTGGAEFQRKNWGADLGGPIVRDRLFFYGSYEETDTASVQNEGPIGAGFNTERGVTLDEANRIRDILTNSYGRDPGTIVRTLPNTSLRYFGRLDWHINDNHKAEVSYARLEENRILGDDINTGRGLFTFSDNFQNRGSVSNTYRFRLQSDWSDNFSTEVRYSKSTVADDQGPLGGGEAQSENFPRIAIGASFANEFFGQNFVSGPGLFRSANRLDTTTTQYKIKGDYQAGDHLITAGYELEALDVFNLFIINGTGTIFFNSIDDLEAGNAREIRIGASFSGDPNDAAAIFKRNIHTLYLQDKWQVSDSLVVTGGIRYDYYKSDDAPNLNPEFQSRFGFANTQAFDGLNALQPRIGFVWNMPEEDYGDTTITGGFATFSGGDPTVWFANGFQNFGGALGLGIASVSCTDADLQVLAGGFSGVPQCVVGGAQAEAQANLGSVAFTDPNFKLPRINRFSFGIAHYTADTGSDFFDDWQINFDVIYADLVNAVDFVDISLTQTGTAPDGRPLFSQLDLRSSGFADGCNPTFNGLREGFSGTTDACFRFPSSGGQVIGLTNAINGGGHQTNVSIQFQKRYDLSDTATLDLRTGYAYFDSIIGNAGQSFTAGSNFEERVTDNFNDGPLGPSAFANKHNLTFSLAYRNEFWEGLATQVSGFFRVNSGTPLSFVFDANTSRGTFGDSDAEARSLLYIPTGLDDPLADLSGIDGAAFLAFLEEQGLDEFAGGIAPRGTFYNPWSADLDLRFSQELPGFLNGDDGFTVFIDFENVFNFLGSGLGKKSRARSGDVNEAIPVAAASINEDGVFVFSNFNADNVLQFREDIGDTLWRINLGIRYKF